MLHWIAVLVVGGILGWLASIVMRTDAQQGILLNIVVGIVGAILGGVAGVLGKLVMPGRDPGGCVVTILLGTAGALLSGFIGRTLGWYGPGQAAGWIAATLGAVILLFVYRLVARRR